MENNNNSQNHNNNNNKKNWKYNNQRKNNQKFNNQQYNNKLPIWNPYSFQQFPYVDNSYYQNNQYPYLNNYYEQQLQQQQLQRQQLQQQQLQQLQPQMMQQSSTMQQPPPPTHPNPNNLKQKPKPKPCNVIGSSFDKDTTIKYDMIKIDLTDPSTKDTKLENLFKALLGIPQELEKKDEVENKLKIKEFDINAEYQELDLNIESITDLIKLADLYDPDNLELMDKYTIDLKKLYDMKKSLTDLNNMIGMESVKKSVCRQILYFLQSIEEQQDMLHMVITGSPGTGKTSLGVILSKIYYAMGLLEKNSSINPLNGKKEDFIFKIYKRSDLIGQYLGHTAIKTQKAIDECIGGVMFLDEAYSLGSENDKTDIYTKECLDTINQNLSENKKNFILIIAGYPEQLDKCFFSHNEGLKRRFAFRYHIDKYSLKDLAAMLDLKIKLNKWNLDEDINQEKIIKLIDEHKEMFENFGGDIESWLLHVKIEHGVRIFGKHPKYRRIINYNDLKNGLTHFRTAKENKAAIEKKEKERMIYNSLYS